MSLQFPAVAGGGGLSAYIKKVLSYSPYAYWPMNESSGGVAFDLSGNGYHGAYTGVTLANILGPDGVDFAPLFDGTNDFMNAWSTGFRDAFNGQLFTVALWAKVFNVGVWTDGNTRYALRFDVDNNNHFYFLKNNPNNELRFQYRAGGTIDAVTQGGVSETGWMYFTMTLDKAADQMKGYYNGSQFGPTRTTLGAWVGNLANNKTTIGSEQTTPFNPFYGYIAHPMVFDNILDASTIADLAVAV